MTAEALLGSLESVRSRGVGRWSARCPAHPDKSPSLSVTEGEKGLLLRCFAGCTIKEITEKLGLRVSDLFFDAGVPDLAERQRARHRRAQERAAQQATYGAEGRRLDALREAEYLVSATR